MNTKSAASTPIRVFLFKRESVDAFHLRLAISMSLLWCDVQVLDQTEHGMRTASAIARSASRLPGLVLLEDEVGEGMSRFPGLIRRSPELRQLPLVVLGDGEDPEAQEVALREGADGFIPLPTRASELARAGQDLARFWMDHRSRRTAHAG